MDNSVCFGGLLMLAGCLPASAVEIVFETSPAIANLTLHPTPAVVGDYKPNSLALGDWNRDGHIDLAAANAFDHSVSIFHGDGAGLFKAGAIVATARRPIGMVTGDWNADGHADLAVTSYNEQGVALLYGNGAGGFRYSTLVKGGHSPQALAAGDLNGDGLADLAVSNRNDHTVTIHRSGGDGRFDAAVSSGTITVGKFPSGIVAGDWNRDGASDLAVVNHYSHSVSVLLGAAQGQFSSVGAVDVGLYPGDIDAADLNSDGVLDLVVANVRSGDLSILFGRGDGRFTEHTRLKAGAAPAGIALADLDLDGAIDIVVAMRDAPELAVFRNDPAAAKHFRRAITLTTGANPVDVAAADFNRDGLPDLLASTPGANAFVVFINRIGAQR